MKICFFLLFFILCFDLQARQVEGRATTPDDCQPDEHWVRDHGKSAGSWTAFCRANRSRSDFWKSRIKNGRPKDWPHVSEKETKWSQKELELVLRALAKIPDQLLNNQIKAIFRLTKSKDSNNPASNGEGYIALYDELFSGKYSIAGVISHELAHIYYRKMTPEDQESYQMATGWRVKNKEIIFRRQTGYVHEDGKSSPEEDFTNNIEYFLIDPDKLKHTTPHAYTWIKNHFNDKFKLEAR